LAVCGGYIFSSQSILLCGYLPAACLLIHIILFAGIRYRYGRHFPCLAKPWCTIEMLTETHSFGQALLIKYTTSVSIYQATAFWISSAVQVPTAVVTDIQNTEAATSATSSCLQTVATMQVHKLATATDFALLFNLVMNVIFMPP
jgi:hypothetical protein